MPGCLVSLGRRKACELGHNWHGGLNNNQSPDPFRVWLDALRNFGTLNKSTLQKRLHVQKTKLFDFFAGPLHQYDTILHSRPPLF